MPRIMVFLYLCHGLLAQPQQADPASMARIEGRVLNSVTGEPLKKAELTLHGGGSERTGTSDANGHFAIEKVAPGTYNLTVQHQNFAVLNYGARRPNTPGTILNLGAGQSMTGLEVKLVPFGVISGKVIDQDGDPVSGVPVMVMRWGFMRGSRQLTPSGNGSSTNDRGEYRLYNLPSGRYYVSARPVRTDIFLAEPGMRGNLVHKDESRESYTFTFYPSALDASAAAPVVVSAGQEVPGMDIQLRKSRTYTIQGKMAGIQSGARYSLLLQPVDPALSGNFGNSRAAAVRQQDGTFTFRGVSPGRYTLVAMANNRVSGRQELTMGDGDLDGVVVTFLDPGSIKGRVQVEPSGDGKTPRLRGLRVSLTPLDSVPMNAPNANTGEDGSFAIDEVSADRYRVACSPVEGAYLKTIRWGGQPSNDGIVDMPAAAATTLDLIFAATTAQIEGDVKTADDQPAAGFPVLLMPASYRESDFRVVMTDEKGHFAAKAVAPGSYIALATDATIYSMLDPVVLKSLEKVTTGVNVEENGHATVSLKVVPESVIEAAQ